MAIIPMEIPVTVKVKVEFEDLPFIDVSKLVVGSATLKAEPMVVDGGIQTNTIKPHEPRLLETEEGVADALSGTIVVDSDGDAWQKKFGQWYLAGDASDREGAERLGGLAELLPAKVLREGWGDW